MTEFEKEMIEQSKWQTRLLFACFCLLVLIAGASFK